MTFAANLQNVGLVPNESRILLAAFADSGDWADVRRRALDDNLMGKRSTITARHILKVVARRYLRPAPCLPPGQLTARLFARRDLPDRAAGQVAFLYTVAEDELASVLMDELVRPRLEVDGASLHRDEVLQSLRSLETEHPELTRWQPYLRKRWASGFLTLLRDGGFMAAAPSTAVARPAILPQAFGFIFGWLATSNGSPKASLNHRALQLWAIDPVELRTLLGEGQDRGWWRFAFRGDMFDFHPQWQTHEDLIDALG